MVFTAATEVLMHLYVGYDGKIQREYFCTFKRRRALVPVDVRL